MRIGILGNVKLLTSADDLTIVRYILRRRSVEKFLAGLQGLTVALPVIIFFFVPIAFFIFIYVVVIKGLSAPSRKRDLNLHTEKPRLSYKYRGKTHIMTQREEKFFLLLNDIFRDKCYIIPQVHLSALLEHRIKGQNWKGAFSHINGKSVDYVLLRSKDLSVLCAVELDDSTHDTADRIERDKEVGWMFGLANVPLIRLRNPENMSKQEIVDSFAKIINKTN